MTSAQQSGVIAAASAPGIGDLCLYSPEWVSAAREVLEAQTVVHKEGLADLGNWTLCEVGHNPPWHSANYGNAYKSDTRCFTSAEAGPGRIEYGTKLAWWAKFDGAKVEVHEGELPAEQCDFKVEGDHGVLSRISRILNTGGDPRMADAARAMLTPQSKWVMKGEMTGHKVLAAVLSTLHDAMAPRTIPRMVWMSPDWVNVAREIITERASNPKFRDGKGDPMLKDTNYVFAEEFEHPPAYVPEPTCGFYVALSHGTVTVGFGALPEEKYGEADTLTKGEYVPILAGGRTVNGALNKEEQQMVAARSESMPKIYNGNKLMSAVQKVKQGSTPMPISMGRLMVPMHEELSLRASGEMPSDFDPNVDDLGPAPFDRHPDFEQTWLRYDKVDVYGQPLAPQKAARL